MNDVDFDEPRIADKPQQSTRAWRPFGASTVLAAVAVVTPLVYLPLVALIWLLVLVHSAGCASLRGGTLAGLATTGSQSMIAALIETAAVVAPCKAVDRVRATRIDLSKQEFTLGELASPEKGVHILREIGMFPSISADLAGRVIHFPSLRPTIDEFIAAVEAQAPLRHRFSGCGNGATLLFGSCAFRNWSLVNPDKMRPNGE